MSDLERLENAREGGIHRLVVSDRVTPMIGDRLWFHLGTWRTRLVIFGGGSVVVSP